MHDVVLVVYPDFELLDTSGPAAVFNGANRALETRRGAPFYRIALASAEGGSVVSSSGIEVATERVDSFLQTAIGTLLIAGSEREPLLAAMGNPALRAAIPSLIEQSQRYGSVCTGVFLLASLGLLSGCRVSTHWDACKPLAEAFTSISVDADALYVVDGRLWTSAGVTTGIDMALAMVAQDLDAVIASEVAKRLVLYARRPGFQSQFSPLLQAQAKADAPFAELVGWIGENLDKPLDVPALAEQAGLSERTFYRRFQAATGKTPGRYVESARMDAARMLLSRGTSLKSVAAQVGLFPTARLVEAFERRFGVSPRLFRDMHAQLQPPAISSHNG